ncbi:hypothetical protein CONPUDRAFT_142000 [Coniophora puteana RWD-64-598 SS2]|uniref:Alpha-ketoglutarate-dependent dioxygenase AlkB-like domain-containing protein n=1 Tax=Coniophora puteana (strain RWD-64-598) TaxID=741705 RepID=A0A5M3N216_CONPW|nr:uncharacterized protein CONPUDRAFT_142000 [Coniophora puteana RWD-64-598 SS2]EIW85430.1 hypothetical protein CONPUDRAFT_142000 [Coniophora puteana RWD-64-598 SS2]
MSFAIRTLVNPCFKRALGSLAYTRHLPPDFTFLPGFLSLQEQRILLGVALQKLDSMENRRTRKRQKEYLAQKKKIESVETLNDVFLPDEMYTFEEGHYDGVIRNYREMHVTSWPDDIPGLPNVLERLRELYPSPRTQTHALHLSSRGIILPHVDNISASGTWILGVSLGAERIMRLEEADNSGSSYDIPLPSGSVYIQRDHIRFDYNHSILGAGPRVSIMVRDLLAGAAL